nr:RING finger protein 17 [Parasteatoda tepidariorum]
MTSINLNMLQSLKPFQCPSCNSWFSSKEAARYNVTRFPRILPCFHSVCENCLNSAVKIGTFECPICKEVADVSEGGIAKLQPDVHSLGIISVNMKNSLPSIKTRYVSPSALKKNQYHEPLKNLVTSLTCQRCHKNEALWQCDECQLNFCSICYGDVHSDMKLKKKHEAKKIFAELYNSMVQEGCPEHENKNVEFYCEIDDQLTCSHCMLMGDHIGHKVKTLLDKNKSCAASLQLVLNDVTKMQRQLKYTDHLICEVSPKEKIDTTHLFSEIHDHFHRLHTLLQIRFLWTREVKTLKFHDQRLDGGKVSRLFLCLNVSIIFQRLEVTSFERDLAAAKKDAEAVIENPCLAISAPALLKKLEDCKNLPCHLVPVNDCDENAKYVSIDLDLNADVEEQIKKIGSLKCNAKPKYTLMSVNELPPNFTPMEIPESFDSSAQEVESCATSVDNFSEDSLSVSSSLSNIQASLKCRDFTRRQPERVSVTHIKSPSSFFVQRFIDARRLRAITEAMRRYCKQNDGRKNRPSELIPGDLYLVKYSADNQWYRGRVLSIMDPECSDDEAFVGKKAPMVTSGGKVIVREKETRAVVYYIDFGNTEIVSINDIRNIQPRFLQSPSFAQECSLIDINPIHGDEWSEECIKTFAKLVKDKSLIMQVYEERNNVFFVDLCQAADNEITSDTPVSVRDMLVFLELALFPSGIKTVPVIKRSKNLRSYMPPESLRVNANISAIVSHVVDPYNFYVQQMSTASYLSKIIYELNETYNKESNPMLHGIYVPYIGLICAAQFSLDKQWYRAEVIGLPGGAKVEVRYVDFGNTEIIHHKYLRKLFDVFLKLNIQAIPCRLAHVSYNQEKCWNSEAKEWLTNEVSRKQLIVKSLGTIPGSNKSEIVIYYSDDVYDVCVNSLMVEKGFATATGPFGTAEVRVRKEIPPPKENFVDMDSSNSLVTYNPLINPPVPLEESIPPPVSNIKSPSQKPKYPTLAPPPSNKDKEYIEVHVSHVESPGCFYIRIAGDMENKLTALMKEMQKVYENLEGEVIDCSIGKAYAIYSQKEKKWLRGTVTAKLENDIVNVHYVDYGGNDDVPRTDLRKLIDLFTKDDAFSIRCHLEGITPTGGSAQWSRTACDALQRTVVGYDVLLLTFKGEPDKENNSLPADLYIENLIQGGALEPTRLEYLSISEELVKNGLGLPVRKKCSVKDDVPAAKTPDVKKEDVNKTNESLTPEKCDIEMIEKNTSEASKNGCINAQKCGEIPIIELPAVTVPSPPKPRKPKFQWLPAVLPLESTFRAYITNVGEDGSVHLYVLKEGNSQVDIIKKALQFKFTRDSYEPLKEPPSVGEACIAKFSVDSCWYRAEVLNIYSEKIKVNFVDYGNNEMVPLKDIRPEIIMQKFARQCIECSLYGLDESFKWDNAVIDFVHRQLVETEVDVEIMGPSNNGKLPCRIKMLSGMDISELLLSMGFDSAEEEDLGHLSVSQTELDEFKTFSAAKEWREGDLYPVCITQVPSPNIVYLQQLKFENPKEDYEIEHNQVHDAFLQLIAELREKADSFPKLKEPLPGMPCCAKYSYDQNWYRCEVTDLTEDGVVVLYVDYGNTEVVSPNDLRELESRFIEFPVQVYFCELHGVKPKGVDWDPSVHERMVKKSLELNPEFEAKVVIPDKILQVDIFTKVDGQYRLVYEDLVEENLIVLDK